MILVISNFSSRPISLKLIPLTIFSMSSALKSLRISLNWVSKNPQRILTCPTLQFVKIFKKFALLRLKKLENYTISLLMILIKVCTLNNLPVLNLLVNLNKFNKKSSNLPLLALTKELTSFLNLIFIIRMKITNSPS